LLTFERKMELFPHVNVSFWNGGLFYVALWLTGFVPFLLRKVRKTQRNRPDSKESGRLYGYFLTVFYFIMLLYTIFLPIRPVSSIFIFGIVLFIIGFLANLSAILSFLSSIPGKPVTAGIYRYSRNPMYFFSIIAISGISLLTASGILLIVLFLYALLIHFQILNEERVCMRMFGKTYEDYCRRVPRYLFFRFPI